MTGQELHAAHQSMQKASTTQGLYLSLTPWSNLMPFERDAYNLLASYVIGEALKFVQRTQRGD